MPPVTQVSHKQVYEGSIMHSRAKLLQKEVNSLLTDCNFNTSENVKLPKCFILMLLRYAHEDMEDTVLQNGSIGKVALTDDQTQGKIARTDDRASKKTTITFDSQKL